jgi:uridine kinase
MTTSYAKILILHRLPFKDGLRDWDCAEALNLDTMLESLQHIRQEGTFLVRPPELRAHKSISVHYNLTHPLSFLSAD